MEALLRGRPETARHIEELDDLAVRPMDDGEMGGLTLLPKGLENAGRSFGKQLVLGEFPDSDGVLVSISINVDERGRLYELDVWKVDFSPLLAWADPTLVRIVP